MKLTEIILQGTAPVQTRAIWAKPSDDGIVELKVFNNGAWQDTVATPDLSPYMKTSDFNEEIAKYLLKTEASGLYQTKTDDTLNTKNKTVVGAINEILPKATGVGKVDASSDGTGEIFNGYEGYNANVASGVGSHAEGNNTTATGVVSHAEGYNTTAEGKHSHAEGAATNALGESSHAEGRETTASGDYSHAEGRNTKAFEESEHAEGRFNKSYDSYSASVRVIHSVGIGSSDTDRKNAHEIKFNGDHYIYGLGNFNGTNSAYAQTLQEVINSKQATISPGTGLEFEGNTLNVTLDTSVFKVVSVLPDSPAQGDENKIHLVPAESTGANNAYTEYVWVNSAWEILGEYTSEVDLTPYLKTADAASTYLSKTNASSTYLSKTEASSTYLAKTAAVGKMDGTGEIFNSYEGGTANVASGSFSHAEGTETTASGYCSHAEGFNTTASGNRAHAEGTSTEARGSYSHAEGTGTVAHDSSSHAEGYNTRAEGDYSHVEGNGTQTFSSGEHAEGNYNRSYESTTPSHRIIHSVGIGSSNDDRKNAHEIKFNGDHYIYGVGGYDGTNPATAQSLQTVLSNLGPNIIEVPELTGDYNIPANTTNREFLYIINIGATLHSVTGDSAIKWAGGVTPTASANSILVVSVLNNLATWQTFI